MNIALLAPDPTAGESLSDFYQICEWSRNGSIDGILARSLKITATTNRHGVCFEPFSYLGLLAARLTRGQLGTCIADPFDVDVEHIAHMVTSLALFAPGLEFRLCLGVRHDAADAPHRIAAFPDMLCTLLHSLCQHAQALGVKHARPSIELVGTKVVDEMLLRAPEPMGSVHRAILPVNVALDRRLELPPDVACHGFAAIEIAREPSRMVDRTPADWVLDESRLVQRLQELAAEGLAGMVVNAWTAFRDTASWNSVFAQLSESRGLPGRQLTRPLEFNVEKV